MSGNMSQGAREQHVTFQEANELRAQLGDDSAKEAACDPYSSWALSLVPDVSLGRSQTPLSGQEVS